VVKVREMFAQRWRQSALPQPRLTRGRPAATVARTAPHLPIRAAGTSGLPSPWGHP
jgi:hypothetical protein